MGERGQGLSGSDALTSEFAVSDVRAALDELSAALDDTRAKAEVAA